MRCQLVPLFFLIFAATLCIRTADACTPGEIRDCTASDGGCGKQTCVSDAPNPCFTEWPLCSTLGSNPTHCLEESSDVPPVLCCVTRDSGGSYWLCPQPPYFSPACEPDDCLEPPDDDDDDDDKCKEVGNPVDVRTGEMRYKPHRADANANLTNGPIPLERKYSTRAAIHDAQREVGDADPRKRNTALMSIPLGAWGSGWYHDFERWLIVGFDSTSSADVLYVEPTGRTESFALQNGDYVGDLPRRATLHHDSEWVVVESDGSILTFEATSQNNVMRLRSWRSASGALRTAHYYGTSLSPQCAPSPANLGKLCRIDESSGYVHFSEYDLATGRLVELTYGTTAEIGRTRYQYATETVLDGTQPVPGKFTTILTEARYDYWTGTGYDEVDSEAYAYTRDSYQRSDRPMPNPYLNTMPIRPRLGYSVFLLRNARDRAGGFISGHEYASDGRAAASFRSGEALLIEYNFITFGESRTIVTNETNGTHGEFRIVGRTIVDRSSGCPANCSNAPATYFRESGHVVERVSEPNRPGDPAVRTTIARDAFGRALLEQENWYGPADVLTDDPLGLYSQPTKARRFSYVDDVSGRHSVESRVFSNLCVNTDWSGISCPSSWADEEPRTLFDYDNDYDGDFNEAPTLLQTQRTVVGLTTTDTAGTVGRVSRTEQWAYVPGSRRVAEHTLALGTPEELVISTDYYGSGTGFNESQVWKTYRNGTLMEERGGYNRLGKPGWIVNAQTGIATSYDYGSDGQLTTVTESSGVEARWTHLLRDSAGRVWRTERGASGTPIVMIDETIYYSGNQESTAPSSASFCDLQGSPVNQLVSDCVNSLGWLGHVVERRTAIANSMVESTVRVDSVSFGPQGQPSRTTTVGRNADVARVSSFAYAPNGAVNRKFGYRSNPNAPVSVVDEYSDIKGHLIARADGRHADINSDHDGNFLNSNESYYYDSLGRVVAMNGGLGQQWASFAYDASGNVSFIGDAQGRAHFYAYDDFNQLVATLSPESGITLMKRDALGRVVSVKVGSSVTTFSYDQLGRLMSEVTRPQTGYTADDKFYHYDNLDGSGAVSSSCASSGATFNPANTQGRLAWTEHSAGRTYYSYNSFGDLVGRFDQLPGAFDACELSILRYGYDEIGRLVSIVYPSNHEIVYERGAAQIEPSRVLYRHDSQSVPVELVSDIATDVDFNLVNFSSLNGAVTFEGEFDLSGAFVRRSYFNAAVAMFELTADVNDSGVVELGERDENGNILTLEERARGQGFLYTYDEGNRLTGGDVTANRGYSSCTYEYDTSGMRTVENCANRPINFIYEMNSERIQVLSWGAGNVCGSSNYVVNALPQFDARGGETRTFARRYPHLQNDVLQVQYNDNHEVESISAAGGPSRTMLYDAQHVRRKSADVTFGYDLDGNLLYEGDSSSTTEYVWIGHDVAAAIHTTNGAESIMILGTDHRRSPVRAWSSVTGETLWGADYGAFGDSEIFNPAMPGAPVPRISLRGPGQVADETHPLLYNGRRYYNPATGRFLSPDPLLTQGNRVQANALARGSLATSYAYAQNNPVLYGDKSGLDVFKFDDGFHHGVGFTLECDDACHPGDDDPWIVRIDYFCVDNPALCIVGEADSGMSQVFGRLSGLSSIDGNASEVTRCEADCARTREALYQTLLHCSAPYNLFTHNCQGVVDVAMSAAGCGTDWYY